MKSAFFRSLYYAALLLVPLAMIAVATLSARHPGKPGGSVVPSAQAAAEPAPLDALGAPASRWICPMHAHILQDHAGSCPICGMDLVETDTPHAHDSPASGVKVDAALQQRMGVRLASAAVHRLHREVRTYGTVGLDETSVYTVSPKLDGWIRDVRVTAVGQRVEAGQVLYEIHSPELVQRQREYIELLQRREQLLQSLTDFSGQNAQMAASLARERIRARQKFAYADVSDATLAAIEKTRRTVDWVPVHAPRSGFVTAIGAREGAYVTPLVNVLSLANTATVWVDIALYADQLEWVRDGDEVTVAVPHSAEPPLRGRLAWVSPVLDPATRTARARLVVRNADRALRPGAFVDVVIATDPREAVAVPRSAVIRTGTGSRVMLAREGGHFMPVAVETGIEGGDFVEIADGLQEGAEVAVNGQFLLDAAASLADAVQRVQAQR